MERKRTEWFTLEEYPACITPYQRFIIFKKHKTEVGYRKVVTSTNTLKEAIAYMYRLKAAGSEGTYYLMDLHKRRLITSYVISKIPGEK